MEYIEAAIILAALAFSALVVYKTMRGRVRCRSCRDCPLQCSKRLEQ